jgi:Uncharacterized protein conserved in bacteria (DUF2199)
MRWRGPGGPACLNRSDLTRRSELRILATDTTTCASRRTSRLRLLSEAEARLLAGRPARLTLAAQAQPPTSGLRCCSALRRCAFPPDREETPPAELPGLSEDRPGAAAAIGLCTASTSRQARNTRRTMAGTRVRPAPDRAAPGLSLPHPARDDARRPLRAGRPSELDSRRVSHWTCSRCGAVHEGLPLSWGFDEPAYWNWLTDEQRAEGHLDSDTCWYTEDDGDVARFALQRHPDL